MIISDMKLLSRRSNTSVNLDQLLEVSTRLLDEVVDITQTLKSDFVNRIVPTASTENTHNFCIQTYELLIENA